MAKKIKLTNSTRVALVDDNMYEYINQWQWRLEKETGYAVRDIEVNGEVIHRYMHDDVINRYDKNIN